MKKFLLPLIGILCLCVNAAQAQWVNITPPDLSNAADLSVIDNKTAVLMSHDSVIQLYKTKNGGVNWESIPAPVWQDSDPILWQGAQFLDEQIGYVYGTWLVNGGVYAPGGTENFAVFKTTDGGNNWTYLDQPVPSVGFVFITNIHFFDANKGVVTLVTGLSYSLIKTTDDGGITWQTRDTIRDWGNNYHFRPDGTGVILACVYDHHTAGGGCDNIAYKTADFGNTWEEVGPAGQGTEWPELRKGLWYESTLYVDDNLVFRVRRDVNGSLPEDDVYHLDKSVDAGITWQEDYFVNTWYPFHQLFLEWDTPWVTTWKSVFRLSVASIGTSEASQTESLLQIAPNPSGSESTMQIQADNLYNGLTQVSCFSSDGRLAYQGNVMLLAGKATINAPLLPNGLYQLVLADSGRVIGRGKWVVLRNQ